MDVRRVLDEKNRVVYKGCLFDGNFNGFGVYYFYNGSDGTNDGDVYEGNFKDSQFHGHGVYSYLNRGAYKGNWACNLPNGQGKFYYNNGDVYTGEYKSGLRDGFGVYTYANGDKYEGNWKRDCQHGQGRFVSLSSSADEYNGRWNNGVKEPPIDAANKLLNSSTVCRIA